MTTALRAGEPLRNSDLVPFRRLLGADSFVVRVAEDGSFAPFDRLPMLCFSRPIRRLLLPGEVADAFQEACRVAATSQQPQTFLLDGDDDGDAVVVTPVLDDESDDCRFLVCWARPDRGTADGDAPLDWDTFRVIDVDVVLRPQVDDEHVLDAVPVWGPDGRSTIDLRDHHARLSAMGFGPSLAEHVVFEAAMASAMLPPDRSVRIETPTPDMLAGIVPVIHGALRASGADPDHIIVAIPVALAVDADLLPVLVHLRTLGVHVDIEGLDRLTATLATVAG